VEESSKEERKNQLNEVRKNKAEETQKLIRKIHRKYFGRNERKNEQRSCEKDAKKRPEIETANVRRKVIILGAQSIAEKSTKERCDLSCSRFN